MLAEARALRRARSAAAVKMTMPCLRPTSCCQIQIAARSRRWRREIERDYPDGEEIHLVAVLKGGFMFMADLVRAMSARVTMDFMAVSSYGKSTKSSGQVRVLKDLDSARRPPRHHRRGHRRHRADADLSAGHPAGAGAEDAADRVPAEQAVAAKVDVQVEYIGFTIEDSSSSATGSTTPRSTATCRTSRC